MVKKKRDGRKNSISMLLCSLDKILCSLKKLCICSQIIYGLTQNLCFLPKHLHSLAKLHPPKNFAFTHNKFCVGNSLYLSSFANAIKCFASECRASQGNTIQFCKRMQSILGKHNTFARECKTFLSPCSLGAPYEVQNNRKKSCSLQIFINSNVSGWSIICTLNAKLFI